MPHKRGRKRTLEEDEFLEAVLNMKNIIIKDAEIASRNDNAWLELSNKIENKLSPSSLFVMVSVNRYGIKDKLLDREGTISKKTKNEFEFDTSTSINDSSYLATSDISSNEMKFDFVVSKNDFDNLIETKFYQQSKGGRRLGNSRKWVVFRAGIYQDFFVKKIWETTHVKCGFLFEHSYVSLDKSLGSLKAHCKCGSALLCEITKFIKSEDYKFDCSIKFGLGVCGKPYLRQPIREQVAKDMDGKHVEAFRSDEANKIMSRENDPEAPIIPSAAVLYNIRTEHLQRQYIASNPIDALKILKYEECVNCIEDIGFDPFYVHYSTNEALQCYKKLCARQTKTCVFIDGTAGIVKKIDKKTIFLHAVAVSVPEGQFSVTHMLSEVSHAQAICNWLKMWRRSGAPVPNACVSDWSKALLHGTTNAFTKFETVEEYADSLYADQFSECKVFLRLDVAHTMKKYSEFCKGLRKPIKTFYMGCIGQLIQCSTKLEAEIIIKKILTVCLAETDGNLKDGKPTACEEAKHDLMQLITSDFEDFFCAEDIDIDLSKNANELLSPFNKNAWSAWGSNLKNYVETIIINQNGDRLNAHYLETFADYLIKDTTLLPLWTNIVATNFGFEGIRPSSAPIEQVFRKIKNDVFQKKELPLRVDVFVQRHIHYLQGKLKLVNPKITERSRKEQESPNEFENTTEKDSDGVDTFKQNCSITAFERNDCPACKIDASTVGSHSCVLCKKTVHALDQCSLPYGEEGHGQNRVCLLCWHNKDFRANMALRDFDNWRNMGVLNQKIVDTKKNKKCSSSDKENISPKLNKHSKRPKESLYFGKQKSALKDIMEIPRHKKIPVIKNGSDKTLGPIHLNGKDVYLKNTCAFDSILMLMLAAVHDINELYELVVSLASNNSFFAMVKHMKEHGLSSHSYVMRSKLLITYYEMKENNIIPGSYYLSCDDNVGTVARYVFTEEHISFTEVTSCENGCLEEKKTFVAYDVPISDLSTESIYEITRRFNKEIKNGKCRKQGCAGVTETHQYFGDIVLLDILFNESASVSLNSLCTEFDVPNEPGQKLKLLGIVDYHNYHKIKNENQVGHYTTVARRRDGKWMRYDDCKTKDVGRCNARGSVRPALIILYKTKK